MHFKSLALLTSFGLCSLLFGSVTHGQAPSLGAADGFAVLGGTTVTSTGASVVTGDLGVSPGTAITGFPPATVTGTIHAGDAVALQAQADLTLAYDALAGAAATSILTGSDLGGLTLTPGVYTFAASAPLNGVLTLDALGDPSAVFIFQIGSTLLAAIDSSVLLTNGARPENVFWQVGSSATLAAGTSFSGNVVALASITLSIGSSVSGRALARTGAVGMDTASVTLPVVGGCTALASIVDIAGGCGPNIPVLTSTMPVVGQVITFLVNGASPGRGGILMASPAGTVTQAFQGCPLLFSRGSTIVVGLFATDGAGGAIAMRAPLSTSLCGSVWSLQALVLAPQASSVSNILVCNVGL